MVMAHLDLEKRKSIEKSVENIKLDTGLSYPENSLVEIASALGASVVDAPLPPFNGKNVKGYIKWFVNDEELNENKPYKAKIYLNSNQVGVVKNFTLAHEIGHIVLHKGDDSFRIDLQDYSEEADPDNQETEANYFAGSLLMPEEKLLLAIKNVKNLEEAAESFGVSRPAIESRLKWLGYVIR